MYNYEKAWIKVKFMAFKKLNIRSNVRNIEVDNTVEFELEYRLLCDLFLWLFFFLVFRRLGNSFSIFFLLIFLNRAKENAVISIRSKNEIIFYFLQDNDIKKSLNPISRNGKYKCNFPFCTEKYCQYLR